MTSTRRLEQDLVILLEDLYLAGTPDYRDDLLQRTARVRQRPAWTLPERWLPMDLTTKVVPGAPRFHWRTVGVLAVIGLLLVAMLAVFVGSQRRIPAPPFGPAANGSIVYAADGDIFTADPATGATRPLIDGPETDIGPVYSLDGTRIAFERKVDSAYGPGRLMVARDDGSNPVAVTPEPVSQMAEWGFSPDGQSIVGLGNRGTMAAIFVVPADGSGSPTFFDVGATSDDGPPQYRPDGSEIMFIGRMAGTPNRGVYALDPATGKVRTIIAPSEAGDIHGANWSPDGTRVAYGRYEPNDSYTASRTHIAAADGSGDLVVDSHPDSYADLGGGFSNDGTRMVIDRFFPTDATDGTQVIRTAVVPVDGSGLGVEIGCPPGVTTGDCAVGWSWSPDDSVLLGTYYPDSTGTGAQLLADPLSGEVRLAPWSVGASPDWQRRAP